MDMGDAVYLNMENVVQVSGTGYFWAWNCNGLFSIDVNTGFCSIVTQDLDKNIWRDKLLYTRCILIENRIVVLPCYTNHIMIYYLKEQKVIYIPIGELPRIAKGYIYKDWLYLFGTRDFKRMNIQNYEIESIPKHEDMVELHAIAEFEKIIYVPSNNADEIISMNLEDYSFNKLHFGDYGIHYNTVLCWKEYLILSGDAEYIVITNLKTEETEIVNIPENMGNRTANNSSFAFRESHLWGDKVVFTPAKMNSVMLYDLNKREWKKLMTLEDDERYASFIEIDGIGYYIITAYFEPEYEPSRIFKVVDFEKIQECNMFQVAEDTVIIGKIESPVCSLKRFLNAIS